MKRAVRYTPQAREDLFELWLHLAMESERLADRIIDKITADISRLADFPESGPKRPEFAEGARSLIVGRWLALYRLLGEDVEIIRVVDQARDLTRPDLLR